MSITNEFYKNFIRKVKSKADKDFVDNQEILNLYKRPTKETRLTMGHITSFKPRQTYQTDILYLPEDKGYKYCLVVVDCNSGITDAEPMKEKTAPTTLKAIGTIFARGVLPMPQIQLQCDNGTEFKGPFKTFFNNNGIYIKYSLPGRHRQTGMVENRNKTIAHAIALYQSSYELVSDQKCTKWVSILSDIIKAYNEVVLKHHKKETDEDKTEPTNQHNQELLMIGSKVRYKLDNPVGVADSEKLHGKFRTTDIRWSRDPIKITNILIHPNQPVFYSLEGIDKAVFTQEQLQVVPRNEEAPKAKQLKDNNEIKTFRIQKIVGHKGNGRNRQYLIKWYGYDDSENSYEPRQELLKTKFKNLVDKYDREHNL